ncbi:gag,protease,endonuclease, reverse transcriptase,RNaseH [Trichosporon asahii var. asahii CBS 8904]|uniref:Gag,protease,endonuclease, reverse transcriptase,RNaseH n=1 Tax=Trichosporon asahii var. asahii (strain CBS 8904) TaxID=1220162 RepID=K1WEP8_TRIAC|nr:gag,protease,endonuclease, reverse transcriptase,RNaseH [Trichosporon asahii var. asahii CBS 8904]
MHFQPRPVTHDDHNCGDHPLDFVPEVKPSDTNPDNHFALASIGLYIASQLPTPGAPRNYKQAMRTPEAPLWQEAYDKEISQLRERGTWRECVTPPGARLIPSVTVCKEKKDKDGNVIGRKMRICAMGSRQVQGRDYTDSYASVCDASVLRGMMAFAAHHDMELEHADAVAAFLNPDLDQPVYMRFPAGYKPLDPNADCLQVVKGLYGLPQSGNLWQEMATKALVSLQFSPIPQSDCLFQRDVGTPTQLRVALYVDDMLGAGKTHALLDQFWDKLNEKFAIVKLGPVDHLLGMTIQRNRLTRTLFITQAPYVKEVLGEYYSISKPVEGDIVLTQPWMAQYEVFSG